MTTTPDFLGVLHHVRGQLNVRHEPLSISLKELRLLNLGFRDEFLMIGNVLYSLHLVTLAAYRCHRVNLTSRSEFSSDLKKRDLH